MMNYSSVQKELTGEVNALFTDLSESKIMEASHQRSKEVLDAKYDKVDINKYVAKICAVISKTQKELLRQLLTKYESLFDGTLGKWKRKAVSLAWFLGSMNPQILPGSANNEVLYWNFQRQKKQKL